MKKIITVVVMAAAFLLILPMEGFTQGWPEKMPRGAKTPQPVMSEKANKSKIGKIGGLKGVKNVDPGVSVCLGEAQLKDFGGVTFVCNYSEPTMSMSTSVHMDFPYEHLGYSIYINDENGDEIVDKVIKYADEIITNYHTQDYQLFFNIGYMYALKKLDELYSDIKKGKVEFDNVIFAMPTQSMSQSLFKWKDKKVFLFKNYDIDDAKVVVNDNGFELILTGKGECLDSKTNTNMPKVFLDIIGELEVMIPQE